VLLDSELEGMWKEALVICSNTQFQHFSGKMKKYETPPTQQSTLEPRESEIKAQISQSIFGSFTFIALYNTSKVNG
jgi:hypothetical protein